LGSRLVTRASAPPAPDRPTPATLRAWSRCTTSSPSRRLPT
jgi:hypothetical protein